MEKRNKKNIEFTAVILLVIFVKFLNLFPAYPNMYDSWNDVWLTWSYDYGFIRRGFLGTVIKAYGRLTGFDPSTVIRHYGWVTVFVFTLLAITMLVILVNRSYDFESTRIIIFGVLALYFCGYGWDTWYKFYGSGDTWLIIFTIISLIAIYKERYHWALLLVIASLLTHEAYIFMYLNCILVGIFIKYLKNRKKKELAYMISITAIASILFVYLQFFSKARLGISPDYIFNQHTAYTGVDYSDYLFKVINDYLFREGNAFDFFYGIRIGYRYAMINTVFKIPIYIEVFKYWKKIIKGKSNAEKAKYLAIPLGIITTIPLFIMHVDYGRWIYAIFFYEIVAIILVHLFMNDEKIHEADEYMVDRIKENIFYYVGLLVYMQALGPAIQSPIHTVYEKIIYFTTLF